MKPGRRGGLGLYEGEYPSQRRRQPAASSKRGEASGIGYRVLGTRWLLPTRIYRRRAWAGTDHSRIRLACSLGRVAFTADDARAYIASVRWQFAKTMPQWPHEYTVRAWRPDLEQEFVEFVVLIRRDGVVKAWPPDASEPRYHHAYLELDGWEYWTMGSPIPETTLINRALPKPAD